MDLHTLKRFFLHDQTNDVLAIALIEQLVAIESYDDALNICDIALEHHSNDVRLLGIKGEIYISKRRYDAAKAIYASLISRYDGSVVAFNINLALCEYQLGHYEEAISLLDPITELANDILILKARCMHHLEKLDDAIDTLESSTMVDDENAIGLLALLYVDNLDYEKFESLRTLNLKSTDFRLAESLYLLYTLKIDAALIELKKLDEELEQSGRVKAMLGLCYLYKQDFTLATSHYISACELMPNHVGSAVNLAWCHMLAGNLSQAKLSLENAEKIERNFADVHGTLAVLATMETDWPQVKILAEKAIKLDKQCASAWFAKSKYLEHLGKTERSQQILNKILSTGVGVDGSSLESLVINYVK